MKTFVMGATGFLGRNVAIELRTHGYEVIGLARTDQAAAALKARGVSPFIGDLESELAQVVAAARQCDAVIFAPQLMIPEERRAIDALLDALEGSGKTLVFTSGTGVLGQRTGGEWSEDTFTEYDDFVPVKSLVGRVETENLVRAASSRGIRSMVIRPPLIWGPDDHGHAVNTYQSVAKTGAACYVGRGLNLYSSVHVEDLAELYRLALEKGLSGALYHSVSGEVPNRWIAEAVARDLGCETRSVTITEAIDIWGKFRALIVLSSTSRTRCPRARKELGWAPKRFDILSQIGEPRLRALAQRQ